MFQTSNGYQYSQCDSVAHIAHNVKAPDATGVGQLEFLLVLFRVFSGSVLGP